MNGLKNLNPTFPLPTFFGLAIPPNSDLGICYTHNLSNLWPFSFEFITVDTNHVIFLNRPGCLDFYSSPQDVSENMVKGSRFKALIRM